MAFFSKRANDPDYVSFEDQLTLYLKWTGDSEDFLGFDRRFAEWCEETSSFLVVADGGAAAGNHGGVRLAVL